MKWGLDSQHAELVLELLAGVGQPSAVGRELEALDQLVDAVVKGLHSTATCRSGLELSRTRMCARVILATPHLLEEDAVGGDVPPNGRKLVGWFGG